MRRARSICPLLLILATITSVFLAWVAWCWSDRLPSAEAQRDASPVDSADHLPAPDALPPHRDCLAGPSQTTSATRDEGELVAACRERAAWVARQFGPSCTVVVHPPFVLSGDLSERRLERCYQETIRPATGAMIACYLAVPPNRPITVLLFADQRSYRENVHGLFGDKEPPYFGSYRPHLRVLALDFSTGAGTISHELTHALVHRDFPAIPDWLNEGLASLHEEYRAIGSRLEGAVNWRLPVLQAAIRQSNLRALESLISRDDFHGSQERLNYAHARYFCLYLQQQGVLEQYYRRLRADIGRDPTGSATLLNLFPGRTVGQLDAAFRRWALELKPLSRGSSQSDSTGQECVGSE